MNITSTGNKKIKNLYTYKLYIYGSFALKECCGWEGNAG